MSYNMNASLAAPQMVLVGLCEVLYESTLSSMYI